MKHEHLHQDNAAALLASAQARLQEKGERLTDPRRAVLEVLARRSRHLSADEVVAELAQEGIHRTTVYRALERFSELGILSHRQLPGEAGAYHLASSSHLHGHCVKCDAVVALLLEVFEGVETAAESLSGFTLDLHKSTLIGLCSSCR